MWILCDTSIQIQKGCRTAFCRCGSLFVMSYPLISIVLSTIIFDKKRIKIKVKS